ncbi:MULTISPECIES: hypothetical protein [Sphingobacterium]|uniref:Uncharacterized protein n=1 Tax=Sphingobacterium kitahiroshimense TaxID=470446 RepID=A0ABV0BNH3_9SPHI|nr:MULTISPECIES: hypothetical protein [unclassified Sphingobacterium]MBB2953303.1 hypothetical protein [Sphingobacterium sp. JUb56]
MKSIRIITMTLGFTILEISNSTREIFNSHMPAVFYNVNSIIIL